MRACMLSEFRGNGLGRGIYNRAVTEIIPYSYEEELIMVVKNY